LRASAGIAKPNLDNRRILILKLIALRGGRSVKNSKPAEIQAQNQR